MADSAISNDFSVSLTRGSDFVIEMFCESCKKDNKYSKAEGFCVDCVEYFCITCMKFHERFLPHHAHQNHLTMPQDFCLEKCEEHSMEIIKFFCESCSSFACSMCKGNLHQNCNAVRHVPEIVHNVEKSTNFQSFKSKLDHCKNELKNITESLIQTKHLEIDKCCTYAKSAIKDQREEINKKFDDLEMNIERSIDTIKTDDTKQLDNITAEYNTLNSECESLRREVEILQTTEQRSKLFITMKNSKDVVERFEKSVAEFESCSKVRKYVYNPNRFLTAVIDDCDEIGFVVDKESVETTKQHRSGVVYDRRKNDLFRSALQTCGATSTIVSLQEETNAWRTETTNIAVIGCSGVGKSTFINSMCEFDPEHNSAAKTGLTETTTAITPYALRRNKNVILWDFPGVGTGRFKKEMYLDLIDFKKFEFLVLVVSMRLTETDLWLMRAIEHHGKTFYLIRSHFDCDLENLKQRKKCLRDDDVKMLRTQILTSYESVLKNFKSKRNIFLIDGFVLNHYDYECFEKVLVADAVKISDRKAVSIILALPIATEYAKVVKKIQLENRLSQKALHAAFCLPSENAVARCLLEEKELYISQFPPPSSFQSDLNSAVSKVKGELLELEERLYHRHVHTAVDDLFEQFDRTSQFMLPFFDIARTYTICRVWLKESLESLLPIYLPK